MYIRNYQSKILFCGLKIVVNIQWHICYSLEVSGEIEYFCHLPPSRCQLMQGKAIKSGRKLCKCNSTYGQLYLKSTLSSNYWWMLAFF